MIISCTNCSTKFRVPDEKVLPGGIKVRCSKCKTVFRFVPEETETAPPSPAPAKMDVDLDFDIGGEDPPAKPTAAPASPPLATAPAKPQPPAPSPGAAKPPPTGNALTLERPREGGFDLGGDGEDDFGSDLGTPAASAPPPPPPAKKPAPAPPPKVATPSVSLDAGLDDLMTESASAAPSLSLTPTQSSPPADDLEAALDVFGGGTGSQAAAKNPAPSRSAAADAAPGSDFDQQLDRFAQDSGPGDFLSGESASSVPLTMPEEIDLNAFSREPIPTQASVSKEGIELMGTSAAPEPEGLFDDSLNYSDAGPTEAFSQPPPPQARPEAASTVPPSLELTGNRPRAKGPRKVATALPVKAPKRKARSAIAPIASAIVGLAILSTAAVLLYRVASKAGVDASTLASGLRLENLSTATFLNTADRAVLVVHGTLENPGNQPIPLRDLRVYFYSNSGEPIAEMQVVPGAEIQPLQIQRLKDPTAAAEAMRQEQTKRNLRQLGPGEKTSVQAIIVDPAVNWTWYQIVEAGGAS